MDGRLLPKLALFIDSSDPGGAETLVVELAKSYSRKHFDVEIWHFGNEWIERTAGALGLRTIELDDRHFRRFHRLPLFARYLSRVIRDRQVSIVHSHLYGAVVGAAAAARLAGCRHVGTLHDVYSLLDRRGRIPILRLAERLGTRIVCVASVIEQTVRGAGSGTWRHLQTIHNGIDIEDGGAVPADATWQSPRTEFVCVARLVPVKNLDVLIRAVSVLTDAGGGVRLRIVGDGPERDRLEDAVRKLGAEGRVEFTGFRDDVEQILASSHCFVLPSRSEGLSCSIMEAMRAGLPVVATDVGGNAELVVDGVTGLLCPVDDHKALANALQRVCDSRQWARQAGRAASERIVAEFSFAAMAGAYRALYIADRAAADSPTE